MKCSAGRVLSAVNGLLGATVLLAWSGLAARADNRAPDVDIAGVWQSEWGPVTFVRRSDSPGARFYTGSWVQAADRKGVIREAKLDLGGRTVTLNYYQSWNDKTGTARLALSEDGATLEGTWQQPGESGKWVMSRPAGGSAPGASPSGVTGTTAKPSPQEGLGTQNLDAIFKASPEVFKAQYAGKSIRVEGTFLQKEHASRRVVVKVTGEYRVSGAQIKDGTPNAFDSAASFTPAWISGVIYRVEKAQGNSSYQTLILRAEGTFGTP